MVWAMDLRPSGVLSMSTSRRGFFLDNVCRSALNVSRQDCGLVARLGPAKVQCGDEAPEVAEGASGKKCCEEIARNRECVRPCNLQ